MLSVSAECSSGPLGGDRWHSAVSDEIQRSRQIPVVSALKQPHTAPYESFGHRWQSHSANATTVASWWTTKPTYFSVVFMGLSPVLVVGFAATPRWIGPDLLRATRVCADKHSSFLRFSSAQL